MHLISWATFLYLLIITTCFTLQGNWSLISNPKVPSIGPPVTL
jgi:hypothetical protein